MKRTNKKFSAPTAWKQCGASMRRAAITLLTLVMAFTAQTAWADYGWYDGSMIIGGATTDCTAWSTDPDNPTDIGVVTDMTITSIAFNVWSDANDRGGANMFFRIWDGGSSQVGEDQDLHLGAATRIAGKDHDFSISWSGSVDLAAAVGLTLVPGKTYYIDMWAKTYKSGENGDEWYSNGGTNYHAKLTIPPASYVSGDCTATLNDGVLTISKTGSGTGAMENYNNYNNSTAPWISSHRNDITSVVIENGVTTIGNQAFIECGNLASVTIPASVTSIGEEAFWCCNGLTTIDIPSRVTTIGIAAFSACDKLASVNIPASVTSIGNGAFNNCGSNATALTVNFAAGSTLTTIGDCAFQGAHLTSISIPASVTSIGQGAFDQCKYLTTIDIPASVTSIGNEAFHGCGIQVDAALTVTFASGSSLTTIGRNAFDETKLSSISIPASVTSIGWYAFNRCTLTTVSIPASVTSIGEGAFQNCGSLTSVTVYANPSCTLGSGAFDDCSNLTAIYVFSDKEEDFVKAEGWSKYAGIIQANPNVTVSGVTARQNPDITTDYWCTYYHPQANVKINKSGVKMFKASLNEDNLTLTEVEGNNVIKAGQAVVLKAATSDALNMELTSLAPTGNFDGNELKGTSVAITGAAGNIYVLNAISGKGAGFYKLRASGTLGANKAYLIYDDSTPDPGTGTAREFLGFGDTTGINDVRGQKEDVRGEYYDLQGRRVSQPTKGLYIVNGKKVVIK